MNRRIYRVEDPFGAYRGQVRLRTPDAVDVHRFITDRALDRPVALDRVTTKLAEDRVVLRATGDVIVAETGLEALDVSLMDGFAVIELDDDVLVPRRGLGAILVAEI